MSQKYEYKVEVYQEGLFGSLLLGQSKVDPEKYSEFLNAMGAQGWRVVTIERERRRMLLLFSREAFVIVFERPLPA